MDRLGGGGAICQEPLYILSPFFQCMNESKFEVFNLLNAGGIHQKQKQKPKLSGQCLTTGKFAASQYFHVITLSFERCLLQQVQ